jgi:hypothetical protein
MRAFYDKTGKVVLWLLNSGWFVDDDGRPVAVWEGDGIYNREGRHIAWWDASKMRDHHGRLLVVDFRVHDLGILTRPRHPRPAPPLVGSDMPVWPTQRLRPSVKPNPRLEWANADALLEGVG